MSCSTISNYITNFPFPTLREKQAFVLKEIDDAFALGYKYIVLEAPTGFGKSPVLVTFALQQRIYKHSIVSEVMVPILLQPQTG